MTDAQRAALVKMQKKGAFARRNKQLHNTFCPECGEKVFRNSSLRGRIRYKHRHNQYPELTGLPQNQRRACKWSGSDAIGSELDQKTGVNMTTSRSLKAQIIANRSKRMTYVITSAQNATPVQERGWQSLLTYCKVNNAQLLVIPYRYKNPTSHWSAKAQADDWWVEDVRPYLITHRVDLNKHLVLLADIMTQPTGERPLLGFETITGAKSGIIGHPKLELESIPTPQSRLAKLITTTGSITKKNYIPSKAGKKAEFHHTFGATIVEVEGGRFHIRQINMLRDGSFCDLLTEYDGEEHQKYERVPALVMGDTHVEVIDPQVVKATFTAEDSMVKTLRPEKLVWHDVFDGASKNYHDKYKTFNEFVKYRAGKTNVRAEVERTMAFIDSVTLSHTLNIFVPSNHNDRLRDWVEHNDPRWDPENCMFWAETYLAVLKSKNTTWTPSGVQVQDAFAYWGQKLLKTAKQALFLNRSQPYQINDIEIGYHGDRGLGGAEGSRSGFRKIGVRSIIGHSHAPGIMDGSYQVGTSSRLDLSYAAGSPSAWLHTHCIVYPNGKRCLVNIIDGKWRASSEASSTQ